MKIIVAVDKNWAIGCGNKLLKSIPEDMKFFKEKTTGHVVIMGRATFQSLPGQRPLKDRVNIVLTRGDQVHHPEVILCKSMEEVLERVKDYRDQEVYIIGGEMIYRSFLPYCDSCLITKMEAEYPADRFFENLDENPDWELISQEPHKSQDGISYSFCEYKKK